MNDYQFLELCYIKLVILKEIQTEFALRLIIYRAVHARGSGLLVPESRINRDILKLWAGIAQPV